MKKIISVICFILTLTFTASAFAEIEYGAKISNKNLNLPIDEDTVMKNGSLIYEAENMAISSEVAVLEDKNASGGYALRVIAQDLISDPSSLANPSIVFNFTADATNTYYFWVKMKTYSSTTNASIWYSIDSKSYNPLWGFANADNSWEWRLLGSATITAGATSIEFKRRTSGFWMDKILITSNPSYSTEGSCDPENFSYDTSSDTSAIYPLPEIKPIAGHPRLIITKDYLPTFKENLSSEELAPMYEKCLILADEELNCDMGGTKYDDTLITRLKARAIAYLAGDRDEKHARQTIEYMKEYFETCYYNPNIGDITRNIGDCMFTGALIYDWCYDVMNEADKDYFIQQFKILAAQKECGYPPTKMQALAGHLGEQEIFQDLLGAGVACYDEDQEMYNLAAGRLFDEMVESRQYFNQTGAHPVSFEYAFWRHACEGVADLIYSRMGYGHIFGDDMYRPSYKQLYARLGMGKWIKDGDAFEYSLNTTYNYDTYDYQNMTIIGNLYRDPYLRGQYIRDMALKGNSFNFWVLVCAEPDVDFKTEEELPLAYKSTYPLTSIIARTGWKHGIDSPAAVAYLDGHEKIISDHPHMSIGQFSLYYKGNLAVDSGTYQGKNGGWGSEHYKNYYARTIAANCVTVFDPNEKFYWDALKGYLYGVGEEISNDGGQKYRINVPDFDEFNKIEDMARTDGIYIGPNEQTPEFSYIKTDLKNSYSDKISHYDRYMAFMDLDNDDYPAALVVFDRVESSNASFKKTWNLHSIEEPSIDGSKTVIARTEDGFNGKLVNRTLLPKEGDFTITKVGGEGAEYMVNGTNYSNPDKDGTKTDSGSWRIELSPSQEHTYDTFLNAMYVTDYDRNLPELPMYKEETSNLIGVTIMDRMVMFSADGDYITSKSAVNLRENGYDTVKCMIGDVDAGLWKVTEYQTGNSVYAEVKEDEHTLYFRGTAGKTYTFEPVSSGSASQISYPPMEKEKHGDFEIYDGTRIIYDKYGSKLIDGVPYIPVKSILGKYSVDVTYNSNDNSVTISNGLYTDVLNFGSRLVIKNGESTEIDHPPLNIDGITYICPEDFSEFVISSYNSYAKQLKITVPDYSAFTTIDTANAVVVRNIEASGDDGNLAEYTADYNTNTRWSCQGDNAWIKYDLGDIYDMDYTQIYWYSGNKRSEKFDILVSEDDINYTKVFEGNSDGVTDGFERFDINASGRYVKIVCHGNSQNDWNSLCEIFIMRK